LQYSGLNSRPTPWAIPSALCCDGFFRDRVSRTICLGWLQTLILLISAFWVAKITSMSHWRLAYWVFFFTFLTTAGIEPRTLCRAAKYSTEVHC
jgi:hypothetical protein